MARDKAHQGSTLNEILVRRGHDPKTVAHAGAEYYERNNHLRSVMRYGEYLVSSGVLPDRIDLADVLAEQSAERGDFELAIQQLRAAESENHSRILRDLDAIKKAADPAQKGK